MTDNLFEQLPTDQPVIDENKNYYEELVGPDAKFKTNEDLAKGKYYADELIKIKNLREDEMRDEILKLQAEVAAKAKLEDMVSQMKERLTSSNNTQANEDNTKPAIKPEDIESMFDRKYQQQKLVERQTENANLVRNKLKEQWGNNYATVLKDKAESLGMSETFVNTLAKDNPQVLFRALELGSQSKDDSFQSPPRSVQRSDSFSPKGAKRRNWDYYIDLKNKDRSAWLDPKTSIQMQKDAIEQGEAFYT